MESGFPIAGEGGATSASAPVKNPRDTDYKYLQSVITGDSGAFRLVGVPPDRELTVELRKQGEPLFSFPAAAIEQSGRDAGTFVLGGRGSMILRADDDLRRVPQLRVTVEQVRDGARRAVRPKRVNWGQWPRFYELMVPGEYQITASVPNVWDGGRPVEWVPVTTMTAQVRAGRRLDVDLD